MLDANPFRLAADNQSKRVGHGKDRECAHQPRPAVVQGPHHDEHNGHCIHGQVGFPRQPLPHQFDVAYVSQFDLPFVAGKQETAVMRPQNAFVVVTMNFDVL